MPQRSLSQVVNAAHEHGGKHTKVGLIVRVRDERIRARYNELSRNSVAPLMKGRLVPEASGTRIVGDIQWTNAIAAPFTTFGLALFSMALGVAAILGRHDVLAALFALWGLGLALLSRFQLRSQGASRSFEEERLREELLATFGGHRPG